MNWSRQGESDCSLTRNKLTGADKGNPLFNQNTGFLRLLSSVQCSDNPMSSICGVTTSQRMDHSDTELSRLVAQLEDKGNPTVHSHATS